MPTVSIQMPQLGESIAEATIVRILVEAGEWVDADQEVIEVETNKATMAVTTLCSGTITQFYCEEGMTYGVGTILGVLEATEEELNRTGVESLEQRQLNEQAEQVDAPNAKPVAETEANLHFKLDGSDYLEPVKVEPSVRGLPVPAGAKGAHYISPRLRARMDELGLRGADISAISGTGSGGRVTVEDLENFLDYVKKWPSSKASPMRLAVADAMRRSGDRPLATVARPIPMEPIMEHRARQDPKPGVTLYLLRAFALALVEYPYTAGFLVGESVVHPRSFDIGVAVQVGDGVMVPVIRELDKKPLMALNGEYQKIVELARMRRLSDDMTGGGIATVTNFGGFGLTWATPIPLPTETLILGLGAARKMPVWSEQVQSFIPVSEAELILSFDHRVIDGGDAGLVLNRVAELLREPDAL